MVLSFVFDGQPVPLARARKGKGGHWFTPDRAADFKERIAWLARGARASVPGWETDNRFAVTIKIGDVRRSYDVDNVAKGILDALTKSGVVWVDDRRVDELHVARVSHDPPYVRVDVRPI